ncbi:MAG TPA: GNAT family N-acetyltransferase [Candidatus Binatia bacterium]|nr:GNAT family N-acetyltransferase [Candidatus Binatia bacterium]
MIEVSREPFRTERLMLRPVAVADAAAIWPVLGDPALYQWIARKPPASSAEIEDRFARISRRTADGRADQWLNWTVWLRESGDAVGIVETTVPPNAPASIAYLFGRAFWGRGYASEALVAVIARLENAGVVAFEATIDTRNVQSRALASRLGFTLVQTRPSEDVIGGAPSMEEIWRRARD